MNNVEQDIVEMGCGWVNVKGFAICINTTQEGILVEVHDEQKLDAGYVEESVISSNRFHSAALTPAEAS